MIYRAKFAPTVFAARQMINHGHIKVNKKRVNISSYVVKNTDLIEVREKSKTLNIIQETKTKNESLYEWLSWNKNEFIGTFVSIPERIQIPENIKEQLIVELYSK